MYRSVLRVEKEGEAHVYHRRPQQSESITAEHFCVHCEPHKAEGFWVSFSVWLPALDWELVPQNLTAEGSAHCSTFGHPSWQSGDSIQELIQNQHFLMKKCYLKILCGFKRFLKSPRRSHQIKLRKTHLLVFLHFLTNNQVNQESQERSHLCLWPSTLTLCSVISRCSTLSHVVYVPVWSVQNKWPLNRSREGAEGHGSIRSVSLHAYPVPARTITRKQISRCGSAEKT